MTAPTKAFCKEKPSIWTIEGKGTFLLKAADSTAVPLFDYKTLHRLPVRKVQTMELIFKYLQPFCKRDAYYWITKACYYESIGKQSEAVKVFESSLSHYPEPIEAITSAFRWFLLRLAEAKTFEPTFEGRETEEQKNDRAIERQEPKIENALESEESSWETRQEKSELSLEQEEQKAECELKKEELVFKQAEAERKIEAENAFKELETVCELEVETQAFQDKVEKALEEAEAFVERTLTAGIHSQECNEIVLGLGERYKMQMESISSQCSQQEYSNSPVYRRVRQEISSGNSPVAVSKKPQSEVDEAKAGLEAPLNRIDLLNTPSKRTQTFENSSTSNVQLLNSPSKDCSSFGLLMRHHHHSTPIKNSPLRTPSSCRGKGSKTTLQSCSGSAKRQLNFDEVTTGGGDSFSGESHSIKYALISTPKKLR